MAVTAATGLFFPLIWLNFSSCGRKLLSPSCSLHIWLAYDKWQIKYRWQITSILSTSLRVFHVLNNLVSSIPSLYLSWMWGSYWYFPVWPYWQNFCVFSGVQFQILLRATVRKLWNGTNLCMYLNMQVVHVHPDSGWLCCGFCRPKGLPGTRSCRIRNQKRLLKAAASEAGSWPGHEVIVQVHCAALRAPTN